MTTPHSQGQLGDSLTTEIGTKLTPVYVYHHRNIGYFIRAFLAPRCRYRLSKQLQTLHRAFAAPFQLTHDDHEGTDVMVSRCHRVSVRVTQYR